MKAQFTKSFSLVFLLCMYGGIAKADCTALFNDLHGYAQPATIGNCKPNFNIVNVKMATNRSDNRYVSYADGYLSQGFSGGGRFPLLPSLIGTLRQTFSDRVKGIYETPCADGSFCFPVSQNFINSAADQLGINLNGPTATLTLKSWGNGKIPVPVTCTASGNMYGEKDGTLFTFSFQKSVYENGCIH